MVGSPATPRMCVNRPMPRKLFKKYLPDPNLLRDHKHLRMFGERLADPNLWHLNRRSVASGMAIGLFCAMLPMPFQMLPAAMLAILLRANLPLSVVLVWLTNPLTMIPVAWASYLLGATLVGIDTGWTMEDISPGWALANFPPLVLGALLIGAGLAVLGWYGVQLFWRLHVRRQWRQRCEARRRRQAGTSDRR